MEMDLTSTRSKRLFRARSVPAAAEAEATSRLVSDFANAFRLCRSELQARVCVCTCRILLLFSWSLRSSRNAGSAQLQGNCKDFER